jgi:hypothetical protein
VALVVFALNGMGLGHLRRSTIVSRVLASVGERPVIFTETNYRFPESTQIPIRSVPSLWGAPEEVRKRVASDLYAMAAISLPAVVVEDTHPRAIQLPAAVRRVLLVRPTSFEYLTLLNERHGSIYSAFLLCDSPDSPTWPYDEAQTRQVAGWEKWSVIGPIYRTPTEDEIREVRARYNLSAGEELCVFTMGGGAVKVQDLKGQDVVRFLRLALQVADAVQPAGSRVRLLFVRGPYFPARIPLPPRFEVVEVEEQMPALLKLAKAAVIRAGFNTTWECIAAGTPFIPLIGTTFEEPVSDRVNRLAALGLLPPNIESLWFNDQWRAEYRRIAGSIVATHSGAPEPRELQRLILDRPRVRVRPKPRPAGIPGSSAKQGVPFVIRIDDVVSEEPAFCWLLGVLAARGLRASLEVVPYLVEFDETLLDRFDPSGTLFEVSQHGYAHVQRNPDAGRRYEFSPENVEPTTHELELIARGKQQLEKAFPKRFSGGFSPPYDALPPWLPASWHRLGGTFVSCLHTNFVPGEPLPVRRAGVDVWDWAVDRALDCDITRRKLVLQFALNGHTGIVLHPRCLRNRSDKLSLLRLLDLVREGTTTVSLRDLALGKIETPSPESRADRLRSSSGGKFFDP